MERLFLFSSHEITTRLFISSAALVLSSTPEWVQMTNQGPAQSTFSIGYLVPEGVDYRKDIDSILKSMDQQMSLWVENSEISKLNRGDSIFLSDDFHGVIVNHSVLANLRMVVLIFQLHR